MGVGSFRRTMSAGQRHEGFWNGEHLLAESVIMANEKMTEG